MPRNLKGGNKAKKKSNKFIGQKSKKDTPLPCEEENSHVAKITGVLGDRRFTIIILSDSGLKNETMLSHLPKTASRRQGRIIVGSIVKISKRDFGEDKGDILYQYDNNEVDYLIQNNIICIEQKSKDNEDFDFCNEDEINLDDL